MSLIGLGIGIGFGGSRAPFSPVDVADLSAWYRGDLGITLVSGDVSVWADQSGTGDPNKDLQQVTAGNRPVYNTVDAGYNGKPTLGLATARCMISGFWAPGVVGTVFAVGEFLNAGTEGLWVFGTSGQLYLNAANDLRYFQGSDLIVTGEATLSAKHIYVVDRNGASSAVYQDGITALTTGAAGSGVPADLRIGAFNGTGTLPANGKIAEWISYTRILTTLERTQIMNYLGTRYGVTVTP